MTEERKRKLARPPVVITKRVVDGCQPNGPQVLIWDREVKGFGLRVTSGGAKSYVFQYRIGGRGNPTRRYKIGRHGSFTPEKARERAKELAQMVARGIDPMEAEAERETNKALAKVAAEEEARRSRELSFAAYAETFLDNGTKADLRKRTLQGYRGALTNHAVPVLGTKPLPDITRSDIARVLDRIPRTQPAVRRITFAVLRMVFNWAKGRGDISASPLEGMPSPTAPASRDRVLSDGELALALRAAAEFEKPFGPFFELLFATGQRREEVAGIDWAELNRSEAMWTLPGERTKNGEANLVPINRMALAVLDRLADQEGAKEPKWPRRGLVFTSTGETSISGFSRAKARFDATMLKLARKEAEEFGEDLDTIELAPWRLHDARRTLATTLQKLGVRFEVTEAVLNHTAGASRSGVAAVYQRHGWGPEKRAALDAWADHCDRLLSPPADRSNVVEFATATSSPT